MMDEEKHGKLHEEIEATTPEEGSVEPVWTVDPGSLAETQQVPVGGATQLRSDDPEIDTALKQSKLTSDRSTGWMVKAGGSPPEAQQAVRKIKELKTADTLPVETQKE
jgi:hypothetical protein